MFDDGWVTQEASGENCLGRIGRVCCGKAGHGRILSSTMGSIGENPARGSNTWIVVVSSSEPPRPRSRPDRHSAQEAYPSRAVTIINAFPPGGLNDIVTRPLAAAMEPILKQPVVIDTKAGAAGQVGAQVAASAKP